MSYSVEHIARVIKAARKKKGLSQRALSAKIGIPQSHISRIENGAVDLKTSSLIELSRALDLELTLVPRRLVPAVRGLLRSAETSAGAPSKNPIETAARDLENVRKTAERFIRNSSHAEEFRKLASAIEELEQFRINTAQAEQIKNLLKQTQTSIETIKSIQKTQAAFKNLPANKKLIESLNQVTNATRNLQHLRNALAHGLNEPERISIPAYRLDEEEDDA